MSMTRRDYIVLAEALRVGLLQCIEQPTLYTVEAYKAYLSHIVKALDDNYDNFNMDKFMEWVFKSED